MINMILETGKIYNSNISLNLYSKPYAESLNETLTVILNKQLYSKENFIYLGKTRDRDFLDTMKEAYWYKILFEGKRFYLWINENNKNYNFKLVGENEQI